MLFIPTVLAAIFAQSSTRCELKALNLCKSLGRWFVYLTTFIMGPRTWLSAAKPRQEPMVVANLPSGHSRRLERFPWSPVHTSVP